MPQKTKISSAETVELYLKCIDDPAVFARSVLNVDTWDMQDEILRSVFKNRETAVRSCHGCPAWYEPITLADGRRVKAIDLVDKAFSLPTIYHDPIYAQQQPKHKQYRPLDSRNSSVQSLTVDALATSGPSVPIYRITTESGREAYRNDDHLFWVGTLDARSGVRTRVSPLDWVTVKTLRHLDQTKHVIAVTDNIPVFGTHEMNEDEIKVLAYLLGDGGLTTGITFTQQINEQLNEFKACCERLDCHVKTDGLQHRVVGNKHGTNYILQLVRKHSMQKLSLDKELPAFVWELPRSQAAIFLSRLYSTDGWASVGKHNVPEIGYCSASKKLITDLQELLLRFGISARIQVKHPKLNGKQFYSWVLSISDSTNILRFIQEISIFGKEENIAKVKRRAEAQSKDKRVVWWRYKNAMPGTHWERIKSIEYVHDAPIVNISVPQTNTYVTSFYEHNSGKCVQAGEWLTLATGERKQAYELIASSFELPTLDGPKKARAEFNAIEPVYALTTETGRRIVRSGNHPLYAGVGIFEPARQTKIESLDWKTITSFSRGDLIAVTDELSVNSCCTLAPHEIKLLAYLIGDGGIKRSIVFTQENNKQLKEVRDCAAMMEVTVRHIDRYDYALVTPRGKPNRLLELLKKQGLHGKGSHDKFVPTDIFGLPKSDIAIFLSRLYSTDGWASVGKHKVIEIGYCSVSYRLARDVQELLLRFGITSRLRVKKSAWVVNINSCLDVLKFATEIGIYGKEEALEAVVAEAKNKAKDKRVVKWRRKNAPPNTHWERVKSVEFVGVMPTIAIEVEGDTFLTEFYEHNTKLAAIAVLAWVRLHPAGSALAITTSASWEQVEKELWAEIRNQLIPQSAWQWPKPNLLELEMPGGNKAFGLSTNDPVHFHGHHAQHVLVVVDEASGIEPEIYEALNGIKASGDVHMLYLMNPTRPTGPDVDLFKDPKVTPFTIDGLQTPNMKGFHIYEDQELNDTDPDKDHNLLYLPDDILDSDPRIYLIRKRFIRDMYLDAISKYGSLKPEAAWWPRVRGLPPGAGEDQLILQTWIMKACLNKDAARSNTITVGIDVAGPGENETALCMRCGNQIIYETAWSKDDPFYEICEIIGHPRPNLWVNVDATGIGYGLASALKREGYQVAFCNAKNTPRDSSQFLNAKAEEYWKLRELFKDGDIGTSPTYTINPITQAQLLTIRWDQKNTKGLVRIEPKEDAAKRGVNSPDRAEAMMLCFAGSHQPVTSGSLTYDQNLIQGPATAMIGPGWGSNLKAHISGDTTETPAAMQKWLAATSAQKAVSKASLAAVIAQTYDPIEQQKLMALAQPAD